MRYIIGIDLGTTNSCVAYIDTQDPKLAVKGFKIPQLVSAGGVESLSTLPSCCYLPSLHEFPNGSLRLPWNHPPQSNFFVGSFAKQQGAKVPTRLVQSAKSWLCHSAANRRDRILPIESFEESMRISPVEASARYLSHIKHSWDHIMAAGNDDAQFEAQEVILTVPASFDEVARTLTVEAAKKAGFLQMTLLEEPQAAFYSWLAQHEKSLVMPSSPLPAGSKILVCDVGGGTTDFSLIETEQDGEKLSFRRIAVGDHLLLGGDNMDRAVAFFIEEKIKANGINLNTTQRRQLLHEARAAKERLLATEEEEGVSIILQGEGSSVVKGTVSIHICRDEIQKLLLTGFFGTYTWADALTFQRTSGFRSMGLPYENEPSIVKHLARFLADHEVRPDFILFNGGAMKPQLFQKAILGQLHAWFNSESSKSADYRCSLLDSYNLDLAVARGAAYFGKARRGLGVKIGGGVARSYYLMLDTMGQDGKQKKALTIMGRGSEDGTIFEPSTIFMLTPNTPVSFQLATSHVRLNDQAGSLVTPDEIEIQSLPPIHTVLRFGRQNNDAQENIPVHLLVKLTPIGTLEVGLKAVNTNHYWGLEFQLRTASGQDNQLAAAPKPLADQTFNSADLIQAEALIEDTLRSTKPAQLMEKLENCLGMPRRDWPPSAMRRLADCVLKLAPQRKASAIHAERWWNAIGFLLRPGFGYPLDDFRIKELWKVILADFKTPSSPELQIQWWICYRRIAGGLSKGQQAQIGSDLLGSLWNKRTGNLEAGTKGEFYAYSEKLRTLASFELLDMAMKIRLGQALAARIQSGKGTAVEHWALGRIGARHMLYGSIVNVVPSEQCEKWIEQLMNISDKEKEHTAFLFEQLARKTEHWELNISEQQVEKIIEKYQNTIHGKRLQTSLLTEGPLNQQEQEAAFGENLPSGLMLTLED